MCGFCNVWVCVCVGFVMCGFCNVWVCFFFIHLYYFPHAPLHCVIQHAGETFSCII